MIRLALSLAVLLSLSISTSAQEESNPVTVRPFAELAIYPLGDAPATAISLNDTELSAEIDGTISAIPVKAGDRVQAGQVVAEFDCSRYQLARDQARAQLDTTLAERDFASYQAERATRLAARGSLSEELVRERQTRDAALAGEVARLQTALTLANRDVKKCRLRAPFHAVVIERIASVGELASVGTPVLRLLDDKQIEVSASVQEQDIATLQAAQELRFVSQNRSYPMRLRALLPLVDSRLRSYQVRLEPIDDPPPPGAAGRLEWRSAVAHLPPDLLTRRDGQLGVFIAEQGRARFKPLPHAQAGRPAALDDLPPIAQLIIDGRFTLSDQDTITVIEPQTPQQ